MDGGMEYALGCVYSCEARIEHKSLHALEMALSFLNNIRKDIFTTDSCIFEI